MFFNFDFRSLFKVATLLQKMRGLGGNHHIKMPALRHTKTPLGIGVLGSNHQERKGFMKLLKATFKLFQEQMTCNM